MKRRDFLKNTGAIASTPLLLNGIPVSGMNNSFLSSASTGFEDRVLVVIQLFGGNDVFNTFVPLNQTSVFLRSSRFCDRIFRKGRRRFVKGRGLYGLA